MSSLAGEADPNPQDEYHRSKMSSYSNAASLGWGRGRLRLKRWGQSCGAGTTSGALLGQDVMGNCRGTAAQEGGTGVAVNCSCGCEIGQCEKVLVGCLGRSMRW